MSRRVLLALVMAGCGGGGTVAVPVTLQMPSSCPEWGYPDPLERLTFTCDGSIQLRLYDASEAATGMLEQACPPFSPMRSVAEVPDLLREAAPSFSTLPEGSQIQLYVDVYSPSLFNCDATGADGTVSDPGMSGFPVFTGGSAVVTLEEGARIDVPLACGAPPLDCADAPVPPTLVRTIIATIRDLDDPDSIVGEIDESTGFVQSGFPASDGISTFFFANGGLRYLSNGIWQGESFDDSGAPFQGGCVGTLVDSYSESDMSFASCDGTYDIEGYTATATAYWLPRARVDELASAAGSTALLDQGILLGRVLDPDDNPLANARIDAGPGVTVKYLDADTTGLNGIPATSASGWFVLDASSYQPGEPRCCTQLTAIYGASTVYANAELGLLENVVMGTVIKFPR